MTPFFEILMLAIGICFFLFICVLCLAIVKGSRRTSVYRKKQIKAQQNNQNDLFLPPYQTHPQQQFIQPHQQLVQVPQYMLPQPQANNFSQAHRGGHFEYPSAPLEGSPMHQGDYGQLSSENIYMAKPVN